MNSFVLLLASACSAFASAASASSYEHHPMAATLCNSAVGTFGASLKENHNVSNELVVVWFSQNIFNIILLYYYNK